MTQEDTKNVEVPYVEIQPDFQETIAEAENEQQNANQDVQHIIYVNVQSDADSILFEDKIKICKPDSPVDTELQYKSLKFKNASLKKINENQGCYYTYQNGEKNINATFKSSEPVEIVAAESDDPDNLELQNAGSNRYTAVNVSSAGEKVVLGDFNGFVKILVRQNASGHKYSVIKSLKAHAGLITKICIFPSDKVMLTSSIDRSIQLFSLEHDYSNPRSFCGHLEPVRDLALIANGRNFLSCADDGTIKLWECGSGLCVHTFTKKSGHLYNPVVAIAVSPLLNLFSGDGNDNTYESLQTSTSSLEFNTKGYVVFAAYNSGHIACFDIFTKTQIMEIDNPFDKSIACTSMCLDEESKSLITGYTDGTICHWTISVQKNAKCTNTTDISKYLSVSCRLVQRYTFQKGSEITKLAVGKNQLFVSSQFDANVIIDLKNSVSDASYLVCDSKPISDYKLDSQTKKVYIAGSDDLFLEYSL
ncbi:hypothetical protein ACO0QE_002957 [Hanseniaspora vineae]